MGVIREDLVRSGRYLLMPDEEWEHELATRKYVIDCYMKNDEWAMKIKKNVGVLLTSSTYGRPYLKGSVQSHKELGFWLVLSYDNFINPDEAVVDYNALMPPKDVMDMVDTFVLPHHQCWGGVSYPYMWQLRIASGIMRQFEYVLCDNGDCILENPAGFPQLLELLGDADILSSGPSLPREIGTAGLLMRSEAFCKIAGHLIDHVVPFEEYEKSTQEFGNTEGRLAVAVRDLGLKQAVVPKEPFNEQHHVPQGTWYDLMGFRHIHGEHNYAYRYKGIPPHYRHLDERFMGDEYRLIKEYHDTGDKAVLEKWWAPE